jgi:hypothetical protein
VWPEGVSENGPSANRDRPTGVALSVAAGRRRHAIDTFAWAEREDIEVLYFAALGAA